MMEPSHTSKKARLERSTDLLNISNKAAAAPSMLIVNQKTPRIYRVEESKSIAGVKNFLDNATQQVQSTDDLNAEVVSEGEAYIEMTLGLIPLEEESSDELSSDRSDSESLEASCEELKLPDGGSLRKQNAENSDPKLLIEEIENK